MKLIVRSSSCEDGNCPKISDVDGDDSGMVAVQGTTAQAVQGVPGHESVVLIPRQLILDYADSFRAEATHDA